MQEENESDSPNNKHTNPLSQLAQNMFSNNNTAINNSTIMLAAIVSLLLVILFVLLLHVYAKWFLSHSHQSHSQNRPRHHHRRRRRRRHHRHLSGIMGPTHFHHHHFHIQESSFSTKGLDSATVSAIPIFVYETGETEETEELECVICLCGFEEGEIGRSLPKCGHAFHVECIDMWLSSHSNCPTCRAPIVCGNVSENDSHFGSVNTDNDNDNDNDNDDDDDDDGEDHDDDHGVIEIVIGTPSYEISETELGNENDNGGSVSETTSSSLLGCSLKRMLSKVFVSSNNVNEELHGGS